MKERTRVRVKGIVQGVGFRPFVYALARRRRLNGRVANDASGVVIDVEGSRSNIDAFLGDLIRKPPPLAAIEEVAKQDLPTADIFDSFRIIESDAATKGRVSIAADTAVCDDCLNEFNDPRDRRFQYPFINCTNCGPRFTIAESVPYDRERTTMRGFPMCDKCRAEYTDAASRRFHAETICCADCGPSLLLEGSSDPIEDTRKLLTAGRIVAVKGLGGYHIACDASNEAAVDLLRRRKVREEKPFALMARDLDVIRKYALVSDEEAELLTSKERPIVLLRRRDDAPLCGSIAPGVNTVGFMLPYTPVHHLLLAPFGVPLVMTSGNLSDEPICFDDDDARARLADIVDDVLTNDRVIRIRTDDSIARVFRRRPMMLRRSRGYAPRPITLNRRFESPILACGAELKNTFCLAFDNNAYLSQHIGDLENLETLRSFTEGIEHYKRIFAIEPEVIAHDLHPEYLSTKYAHSHDACELIGVQHHHAHIASCMADNDAEGEVIGIAMDGLGFGLDGKLWGGEFFVSDLRSAERIGHLANMPLAGGSRAIKEPWRMAVAYLNAAYGEGFKDLDIPFVKGLDLAKTDTLLSMIRSGTNSPETSSVGRLFDALAALLGLRSITNYEGQAAIALETAADADTDSPYEFAISETGEVDARGVIRSAVDDLLNGVPVGCISAKFHSGLAEMITRSSIIARERYSLDRVALSGGVFQNMRLLGEVCGRLEVNGFEVLTHRRVPANDGGISLGQAVVANARIRS